VKLSYQGEERVEAEASKVWAFLQDPHKVASCLPDLQEARVLDERHLEVVVFVSVGPVRGRFKFAIELRPNPEAQEMAVTLRGGGLGSAIDLQARAEVRPQNGVTLLSWQGEATVSGPAATVGGRVLDSQAKKLIRTVFENMARKMDEE